MIRKTALLTQTFLVVIGALCAYAPAFSFAETPGAILAPEVSANLEAARSAGLYRDPELRVLSPGLAAHAAATPNRTVKAWVFFTDKGLGTAASYREALDGVRATLNPRTQQRRRGLGPDLGMSFTDVRVYAPYVEALADGGFAVRRTSRWLNAVSIVTKAGALTRLESFPFVRRVQPVLVSRGPIAPVADPGTGSSRPRTFAPLAGPIPDSVEVAFYGASFQQNHQIQAVDLHRLGYSGAGVRVMILDTGFKKDHPAFDCVNWIAEWDFVNEDGNTQNEEGESGVQHNHGTGVWGTAGGYAPGNLIGPAFAAEFVLAKTEDIVQEVRAEEDNYVAALEWADTLGVDVTSASLSYFTFDDTTGYTFADLDGDTGVITVAVDIAVSKGICCVNSAGNAGPNPGSIATPVDADSVIAVGAVDSSGVVAGFSSRGPTADGRIKPEISARGVLTTWARAATDGYGQVHGTSLSAPLVGGLAALIKEANPGWSGAEIREAIMGTGTMAGAPDNNIGWGIARGLDAITFAGATPEPARMTLPFIVLEPADGVALTTDLPTLTWSSSIAANPGDQAVYSLITAADPAFTGADTVLVGPDTTYTFAAPLPSGTTVWWRVEAVGNQGFVRKSFNQHAFTTPVPTAVGSGDTPAAALRLAPAFPNPMRRGATFAFDLPERAPATLEILSVHGRLVRRFAVTETGSLQWDGRDDVGRDLPAGMYVYRLVQGDAVSSRKLVRLP